MCMCMNVLGGVFCVGVCMCMNVLVVYECVGWCALCMSMCMNVLVGVHTSTPAKYATHSYTCSLLHHACLHIHTHAPFYTMHTWMV